MIRSLLSVALGYIVMLVAVVGGEMILTALAPDIMPELGQQPDAIYFVFKLSTGFFFIVIGAYVTALLAGRSEMKHALGLGALSVAMCIIEVLEYPGEQPLWYSVALMFLSIPSALAGGHFRVRQLEEGSTQSVEGD